MNRYTQNTLNLCGKAHSNNSYDGQNIRSLINNMFMNLRGQYKIYLINI